MIQVQPGQTYSYDFPIPPDHPSGLHWYHPHNHGSTDVQVSNGMAGLVIVVRGPIDQVPEIKAAREIFMVVQTLDVNPSKTRKRAFTSANILVPLARKTAAMPSARRTP